jgi:hypothetical protein
MKKPTRKSLVRRLDHVFSQYIIERDGHCVTCGATENLQCGHLFSRIAYSTRWQKNNAFCQCASCNLTHEHDPGPLTLYFMKNYGSEAAYEELHRQYRTTTKLRDADLQFWIEDYQKSLANMKLIKANAWR